MRINLFGGPGAGKSTTAAWLFAELKMAGMSVEHVGEYVKTWAYADRKVQPYDQVYILGKQMQYEYRFIVNGVKNIVTDSPVLNSYFYAPFALREPILTIARQYERSHPSLNILLNRRGKQYLPQGRYQTELEARDMDLNILADLTTTQTDFHMVDYSDRKQILALVLPAVTL